MFTKLINDRLFTQPTFQARLKALQEAGAVPTPTTQPATPVADPAKMAVEKDLNVAPGRPARPVEGDLKVGEPMAIFQQNQPNATPGPYVTQLSPTLEASYRQWVQGAGIPTDPDHPQPQYDTRGLWRDHGWQAATQAYQRPNYQRTLPDTYRTPFHRQFSSASQYSVQNAAIAPNPLP